GFAVDGAAGRNQLRILQHVHELPVEVVSWHVEQYLTAPIWIFQLVAERLASQMHVWHQRDQQLVVAESSLGPCDVVIVPRRNVEIQLHRGPAAHVVRDLAGLGEYYSHGTQV